MPKSVLFVCDVDSQVLGALRFAPAFRDLGWHVAFSLEKRKKLPGEILSLVDGIYETVELPVIAAAEPPVAKQFDVLGVFSTGSKLASFRSKLAHSFGEGFADRPFTFCGFNGFVYENFEQGLVWRFGYDAICLNGPRDRAMASAFVQDTPYDRQPFVVVGMNPAQMPKTTAGSMKTLVFAEQVAVPRSRAERNYLAHRLSDLARQNPDWRIVIKPRVRVGEQTFHRQSLHFEELFAQHPEVPENLVLSYQPLSRLLEQAALLVTVSSTAFFEALRAGVPAVSLLDFGIKNSYGTHLFWKSGCGIRLDDLKNLNELSPPVSDQRWLREMGVADEYAPKALIAFYERWLTSSDREYLPQSEDTFAPNDLRPLFPASMTHAEAALERRQFELAAANYAKAIELRPWSFEAFRGLGWCYVKLADRKKLYHLLSFFLRSKSLFIAARLKGVLSRLRKWVLRRS